MAPHPFTTIDPNIGFCLVPAPRGSCPEEDVDEATLSRLNVGSSHGRDNMGRRLLPVLLKDVAGLVPGAYQGRGRGNKFLNDLTDATVLVHVVDSSGTADAEGNVVGEDEGGGSTRTALKAQPLEDLSWIRNELIEWVFNNLIHKWDSVSRRGKSKLSGMFSGYGQTSAVVSDVMYAVEKHMEKTQERDHALDHLGDWDAGGKLSQSPLRPIPLHICVGLTNGCHAYFQIQMSTAWSVLFWECGSPWLWHSINTTCHRLPSTSKQFKLHYRCMALTLAFHCQP